MSPTAVSQYMAGKSGGAASSPMDQALAQYNPGGPERFLGSPPAQPQPGGVTGVGTPGPPGYPGTPDPAGYLPDAGNAATTAAPTPHSLTGGSAGTVPASAQGYNQGVGQAVASGPAALQPTYVQASPVNVHPLLGPSATGFLAFIRRRL